MVSVLLVTYNHERFIERALSSIAMQRLDAPFEVVVSDDSSSDATLALVSAWAETVDIPVRILPAQPRLGITLNYARGFASCRGRYVAVLEGDDEWLTIDKLQLQVDLLESDPALTMAASRILVYDDATGASAAEPMLALDAMTATVTSDELAAYNWFATFSCCMFRAEILERLDPAIFETTAYDWLINMAVTVHGPAGFVPVVATLYRIHSTGTWSSTTELNRTDQIRRVIPRYVELLGGEAGRELTRLLHALDALLRDARLLESEPSALVEQRNAGAVAKQSEAGEEDARVHADPVALPIPRVTRLERPRVSVIMASYNHAPYVLEAVNSVLDQTMADLELVIVDDGSADDSLKILSTLTDPRVRVYRLAENQGACAATNLAIQQTRGGLVALINSDDVWEPHKLQRQLDALSARPDVTAVFSSARFIGEDGVALPQERIPFGNNIFRQPNRTRAQWLRYFFEHGNALCHPSMLIRRAFYEDHGLYDGRLRQLPDLERWITLVKHHDILVLGDEDLVRFRLLASEQNASSLTRWNVARGLHEHIAIQESFFDDVSDDMLVEAFLDQLQHPLIRTREERECEIALLLWNTPCGMQDVNRIHAQRLFRELLGQPRAARLLRARYGISDLTLHYFAGMERRSIPVAFDEWLTTLDELRSTPPDDPDLVPVGAVPAGQLVRIAVSRTRRPGDASLSRRAWRNLRVLGRRP